LFLHQNNTKGWRSEMKKGYDDERKKKRERRSFIPEERLMSYASGGPIHLKTEEHLDILAGH
jgi:hypothetical protein